MKYIKEHQTFEVKTFNDYIFEKDIYSKTIKFLHEGIRVVKSTKLNEGLVEWAKDEMDRVIKDAEERNDKAIISEFVPEMTALLQKFADSGQSGGSAPYTAGAITGALNKLMNWEIIAPLENSEDEWADTGEHMNDGNDVWYQNNRLSSVFKEGKDGKPYYIDAIVWKDEKGLTFTGSAKLKNGEYISSSQYIKSFPFTPKTFVIDVINEETKPDEWEAYIKDESQLEEVFKYYDKKTFN